MLQHVLWRGSTRIIKDAAPAWLVLRTSGTAATWIIHNTTYNMQHVGIIFLHVVRTSMTGLSNVTKSAKLKNRPQAL